MKIFKSRSTTGAIVQNTFLSFFAKMLTYFNFSLVAYIFGAQRNTDVYYLGLSFMTACSGIFIVLITSVFSPILIRIKIKDSLEDARVFAGSFFYLMFILLLLLSLIIFLFPVPIFSVISKFPLVDLENNNLMLMLFSIAILLTVVTEFGRVYIQSLGHFAVVAYITLIQALIFVVLILALSGVLNVLSLVVALTASLLIQVYLLFSFCKKHKILPVPNISINALHFELIKTSIPLLIAHAATLFVTYSFDYLASGMEAGALTAVTFALKIYILPMTLFFNPMLEVINTRFSEYYQTDRSLMAEKYTELQRFFVMILTPVMVTFIFFRLEIVKVFFERGAFGEENAIMTANCLGIYACTIVTFCSLTIIARVYFITQKTGWSSLYGTISQLLALAIAYFTSKEIGYIGIPVAKVAAEILFLAPISFWLVNKYLPNNAFSNIILPFLGMLVLASVLGFLSFQLFQFLNPFFYSILKHHKLSEIAGMMLSVLLFFLTYSVILYEFRFAPMRNLVSMAFGALSKVSKKDI